MDFTSTYSYTVGHFKLQTANNFNCSNIYIALTAYLCINFKTHFIECNFVIDKLTGKIATKLSVSVQLNLICFNSIS